MTNIRAELRTAVRGGVHRRAAGVAAVVTPILTALNHTREILALDLGTTFWAQVALTFLVPFFVSFYSSVMTERARAAALAAPTAAGRASGTTEAPANSPGGTTSPNAAYTAGRTEMSAR